MNNVFVIKRIWKDKEDFNSKGNEEFCCILSDNFSSRQDYEYVSDTLELFKKCVEIRNKNNKYNEKFEIEAMDIKCAYAKNFNYILNDQKRMKIVNFNDFIQAYLAKNFNADTSLRNTIEENMKIVIQKHSNKPNR